MELVVLSVPDCPNVALLDEQLATLLVGRDDVQLMHRQITDLDQANREGMHGSPTMLVDGTDPFADPDATPSVSCRLFPDDRGHLRRSPSFAALTAALAPASAASPGAGGGRAAGDAAGCAALVRGNGTSAGEGDTGPRRG
ncbi:hypothetical protein OG943_19695 [Amycolatopsis sp. NBC_00345]|uniref:hypothetical protein n=1 Tax=Amycolatopsis sp. NBC_00345 TaxID=2975955 RepID=UPI002E270F64